MFCLAFFFYHNRPQTAGAAWWNDSWQYRQSILVTNNTSTQNNVYISVTLNTATASTSMQADCGDFRFTRENGEVLPYYIVSGCRTATNVIHINFPVFDAGAQAIYFYYGNQSAENGFEASDFATVASNYTIGAIGTAETGPGPVAYWSFDEGYGTTAHDDSGQANTGTITGATWKNDEECVSGKCLYFDGNNDYVNCGSASNLDNLGPMTYSVWIRQINVGGLNKGIIMGKTSVDGGIYGAVSTDNLNKLNFYSSYGSGGVLRNSISNSIVNNKWQFLTVTFDGSSNYSGIKIYINGNEVTYSIQTNDSWDNNGAYDFVIGNDAGQFYDFHGYIDEAKVYSYIRTADQIKQDYNAGLSGVETPGSGVSVAFGSQSDKWLSDGLVGYWKMDETATTSGAIDASGNGNTGTYYGDASTTAGKFGNGGRFDGSSDYVDLGNPSEMQFGSLSSYSINFWVKADDVTPTLMEIISKTDHNGGNQKIHFYLSGGVLYRFSEFAGPSISSSDGWVYISYTYTAISENYGKEMFYKNGSTQWTRTGSMPSYQGYSWKIGGIDTYWPFKGQLDEVRIYNRALSKSEVQKLYEWAPGPVAHWKLDEGSGTSAFDTSGFGTNATLTNGPAWVPGKYGQAMSFDGDNEYANFTSTLHNGFNFGKGSFSVGMWLKPESFNCNGGGSACSIRPFEMAYCTASPSYFSISISTSTPTTGNFGLTGYDSSNIQESTYTAGGLVSLNNWYYFTAVIDRTNNIGRAYLNGVQSGSDNALTWTGVFNCSAVSSSATLGGYANNYNYKGLIDDVKIYNYARTQKQILEDMNGGGPAFKSPILHLSFDEGFGTLVHDSSAYAHNGTPYPGTGGGQTATSSMWDKGGSVKGAMEFDGTDDYVKVPYNSIFNLNDSFSYGGWLLSDTNGTEQTAISNLSISAGGTVYGYKLGKTSSNYFKCMVDDSDGPSEGYAEVSSDKIYTDGAWHHILCVVNSMEINMYVDGVLQRGADTYANSIEYSSSVNLTIGAWKQYDVSSTLYDRWNGKIDEVKIWNYALSEDEIKQDYNSGSAFVMGGGDASANNNGTTVTGASTDYCVPGDTAVCSAPVLELKMDEMTSGTVNDTSGSGLNWSISGAVWTATGKFGSALAFDGNNDYVESIDSFFAMGDTVSAWVYLRGYGENNVGTILQQEFKNRLRVSSSGELVFEGLDYTTTNDRWSSSDNSLVLNKWNHVVVTNFANPNFYINGIKITVTQDVVHSGMHPAPPEVSWMIGDNYSHSGSFNGIIDDVKIYSYARTPAQIAWDYNRGKPVAEYRFDERGGSVIHDESGNAHNGTLSLGASGVTAVGTCASSSNSFWYNGRIGKNNSSASFDGANDYIDIGDTNLDVNSISFWVKQNYLASNIIDLDGGTHKITLSGGAVVATGFSSPAIYVDGISKTRVPDNAWHHVLITTATAIDVNNFDIGRIGTGYFTGQIDGVKLYNYVLTATQAKTDLSGGAVGFGYSGIESGAALVSNGPVCGDGVVEGSEFCECGVSGWSGNIGDLDCTLSAFRCCSCVQCGGPAVF